MLLYLQCFVGVSGSKDFRHLREITFKYIQPLFFFLFVILFFMGS